MEHAGGGGAGAVTSPKHGSGYRGGPSDHYSYSGEHACLLFGYAWCAFRLHMGEKTSLSQVLLSCVCSEVIDPASASTAAILKKFTPCVGVLGNVKLAWKLSRDLGGNRKL